MQRIRWAAVATGALAILTACASTQDGQESVREQVSSLPNDPSDEAMQTGAYTTAFLNCTCLFVEGSTLERCLKDWPGKTEMSRTIDQEQRRVTVTLGRWVAVAQDDPPSGGCRVQ